jgi:SAM-dependent methyltransferase
MKRNFLFAWYETPRGKLQKQLEIDYLQRSITVSCKQVILQIGGLGWENEFIDTELYSSYTIIDAKALGYNSTRKIRAKSHHLPLQSDSVDMIILPHLLEFDISRFQTIREIERILKPEGLLVILWNIKMADDWRGHFIGRARILDWLKLMNFEVISLAQFNFDSVESTHSKSVGFQYSMLATAYGIKAVKRRYGIIPLTPVKNLSPRLAMANSILFREDKKP